MRSIYWPLLLFLVFLWGGELEAAKHSKNPHLRRPIPVGFALPSTIASTEVNPATILNSQSKVFAFSYFPDVPKPAYQGFGASYASANETFGVGFTYNALLSEQQTLHQGAIGLGMNLGGLSIGVSFKDKDLKPSLSPEVDVGTDIPLGRDLFFGFAIQNAGSVPDLALGLGYEVPQNFSVELNIKMATMLSHEGAPSPHRLGAGAAYYFRSMGVSYLAQFTTIKNTWNHEAHFLVKLGDEMDLTYSVIFPTTQRLTICFQI